MKSMHKVWKLGAVFGVFALFPLVGIVLSWNHGHRIISNSAAPVARSWATDLARDFDAETVLRLSLGKWPTGDRREDFERKARELAPCSVQGDLTPVRSFARETEGEVMHHASFQANLKCRSGSATMLLEAERAPSGMVEEIEDQAKHTNKARVWRLARLEITASQAR